MTDKLDIYGQEKSNMVAEEIKEEQEGCRRDDKGRFISSGNPLRQFKPGESGNPNGRKNAISDIFNELLDAPQDDRTVREAIAERMIAIAKTGQVKDFFNAFDRIIDRTEGKALERVQTQEIKDELIIE